MASKSFVRKQSPPSSSPTNANHDVEQLQSSVNHQGSTPAAGSWAAVAHTKYTSNADQAASATPSSSSPASSSPRLKQKKDDKNAQKQNKGQSAKGQSSSSSSSPTPNTPASSTFSTNSTAPASTELNISPSPSASSSSSSSSPWWHNFAGGLPLGCQVRVQSKNGQDLTGLVLSFEESLKILVLELSPPSSSSSSASSAAGSDYCMLHFDAIVSVTIVKSECVQIILPQMKDEELKLKEQKAIEARREAASRIGVNVSVEAQRLFNAMSKAYPCVWANDSIVVADVVSIGPPYTNDQVKPLHDGIQQDNLLRVQKILKQERQRLKMK